jgi:predicted aspartyl protease
MGTFRTPLGVANPAGGPFDQMEALVDTGARYTTWPGDRLEALGLSPEEHWPFVLADGREVSCGIAWARVRLAGRIQPTIVIFGEPGSEPLLGAFTLEGFRLAADPVNRRLVPVRGLLKTLAA